MVSHTNVRQATYLQPAVTEPSQDFLKKFVKNQLSLKDGATITPHGVSSYKNP
jgi:hypothetical protein